MPLVERDGIPFEDERHRTVDGPGLVGRGVLPDVRGLYPWAGDEAPVDGALISHAHLDHCGLASYVRPDAPVFVSNDTLCLVWPSEQFVVHPVPSG